MVSKVRREEERKENGDNAEEEWESEGNVSTSIATCITATLSVKEICSMFAHSYDNKNTFMICD